MTMLQFMVTRPIENPITYFMYISYYYIKYIYKVSSTKRKMW